MVENPNIFPNNALFNGMSDFYNSDTHMPVLTPVGQKHDNPRENQDWHDTGKYIGDENPPRTIHRPSRASTPVTNTRVITTPMDKPFLRKFSGYSHEDATKFLSEFISYCVFHDLNASEPRKIAAFHLHLQGLAFVWLIMESAMFDSLRLAPSRPLENFYSVILEKGRKLEKT